MITVERDGGFIRVVRADNASMTLRLLRNGMARLLLVSGGEKLELDLDADIMGSKEKTTAIFAVETVKKESAT